MPGPQAAVNGENLDSLGGRYQLIERLGAGGMCEVFLASARGIRSFHKLVVIKRMLSSTAMVAGSHWMFMDEAEITARFNHPNIVQTFEIVSDAEHLSIVMEFLEGQPLNRIFDLIANEDLSRTLLADRNVWVRIIADALKGLHYAHELCDYDGQPLNIVHRDISPQNLFLTYDGVVKIVDFGIAKAALSSIRTEIGTLKGKIGYMAPEQAESAAVDRRTDIFSTGVVLWEFLAGRCLRREEPLTALRKILSENVPALSTIVPDVPAALEAIVAKATARNPDHRYASAQEMRLALEEYLGSRASPFTTSDVGQAIAKYFARDRQFLSDRIREVVSGTPPRLRPAAMALTSSLPTSVGTTSVASGDAAPADAQKWPGPRKVIAAAGGALISVMILWSVLQRAPSPPKTGAITIESVPAAASVHLDGLELGATPVTARATAGTHRVTVFKDGFTAASSSVETTAGETVKLSLALSPIPAAQAPLAPPAVDSVTSAEKAPAADRSPGPSKPTGRAPPPRQKAEPAPQARPGPPKPNIQIIDESVEAKVKVDVIE